MLWLIIFVSFWAVMHLLNGVGQKEIKKHAKESDELLKKVSDQQSTIVMKDWQIKNQSEYIRVLEATLAESRVNEFSPSRSPTSQFKQ